MKKIAIVLLVLASLIVFTGCGGGDGDTTTTKTFIGGTTGLLLSFQENAPPTEVLDGGQQPFTISVKLENNGETDVLKENCDVSIKGINPVDFNISLAELTKNPLEDIESKRINPDTGEEIPSYPVYVDFEDLSYSGSLAGGSHEFPIVADVCYLYSTEASAELCIKEDLADTLDTHVCKINGERRLETSGAPVQITAFNEYPSGNSAVSLAFTIKNMGNGDIAEKDTGCSEKVADEDKIWVEVDTGMQGELTCSGLTEGDGSSGFVKLSGGERLVTCKQKVSDNEKTDYIKVIGITLTYDYLESTRTTIKVKHSELDE